MDEIAIPFTTVQYLSRQPTRSSSQDRRWVLHEATIYASHFHKVLCDGSAVDIILVGLANATKEVDWVGVGQIVANHLKHVSFRLEDLFVSVAAIGHVQEGRDGRADNLFVFGSDEKSSDTDELELDERYSADRKEAVDNVGSEEDGFR